ncbi:hypothetical protein D3C78_1877690 [compost metagenome]
MLDLFGRAPGNRLQAEGHVIFHAQMALAVGVHQLGILFQEGFAVDPAQAAHLRTPE